MSSNENLKDYIYLKDLVADCGGIEKFRFFGHLDKYALVTPFGLALSENSDDWVECKIEDDTKEISSTLLCYSCCSRQRKEA